VALAVAEFSIADLKRKFIPFRVQSNIVNRQSPMEELLHAGDKTTEYILKFSASVAIYMGK
jgi:hypothetical protein